MIIYNLDSIEMYIVWAFPSAEGYAPGLIGAYNTLEEANVRVNDLKNNKYAGDLEIIQKSTSFRRIKLVDSPEHN